MSPGQPARPVLSTMWSWCPPFGTGGRRFPECQFMLHLLQEAFLAFRLSTLHQKELNPSFPELPLQLLKGLYYFAYDYTKTSLLVHLLLALNYNAQKQSASAWPEVAVAH